MSANPAENPASQEAPAPGQNPGSQQGGAALDPSKYVSLEAFNELKSRVEGQSGVLGKVNNSLEKLVKSAEGRAPQPEANPGGEAAKQQHNPELTDAVRELQRKQEELDAQRKRNDISALRNGLHDALVKHGADPEFVEFGIETILSRNGDSLSVNIDDRGVSQLTHSRLDGTSEDLSAYVKSYLETDSGKKLIARRRNPTGGPGGDGGVPPAQVRKLSRADYRNGNYTAEDKKAIQSGEMIVVD